MKTLQMPEFYPVTTVADLAALLDILAQNFAFDPTTTIVKLAEGDWSGYILGNINLALVRDNVVIVQSQFLPDFKTHLEDEINNTRREIEQARATLRSYGVGMED